MISIVSNEQIEQEKQNNYKPQMISSGFDLLPFTDLSDREFELLSYLLVQKEINKGKEMEFTSIALMQGVGERGRDCILYKNSSLSGLIQCKNTKANLTRPATIKEIVKFILFSMLDSSIMPSPEHFHYKLYVAKDLTENALILINSHFNEIDIEINNGKFSDYINGVVGEYESFLPFRKSPPVNEVANAFKKMKISYSNGIDLTERIYSNPELVSLFFKAIHIVDTSSADKLIRQALDDYGLKLWTDSDLANLRKRIGDITSDNRANFGFVDIFGLNRDFFKSLSNEQFKKLFSATADVKLTLDKLIIEYISEKMNELILSRLTNVLLRDGAISPLSITFAGPYLFKKVMPRIISSSVRFLAPNEGINKKESDKETLITIITNEILQSSERVMNGDFSQLKGSDEDVFYKKQIFEHLHSGFSSIEAAKQKLEKDIKLMMPVIDTIEQDLFTLIDSERTIVIKDSGFIDNKESINSVLVTFKSIDKQ